MIEITEEFIDALIKEINQDVVFGYRLFRAIMDSYRNFVQTVIAQWGGTVTKWKRTVKATDEQGQVLKLAYEVDVVVVNSHVMLIECKSKCDRDDVERFIANVQQYERLERPVKPVEKAILTFYMTTPARDQAEAAGITVIMPE